MNELLLERERGGLATDTLRQDTDPPLVAVEVAEIWFVLGRFDEDEYRVLRTDRLIRAIGADYRSWWLYPAAFESQQLAADALAEILDPAMTMEPPKLPVIMVEMDAALVLARLQPDQRDAFASAIAFVTDRLLLPFADTDHFTRYQEADREAGQPWSGADFDYAIALLRSMQDLLEVRDGQQIILVGREPREDPGGDSGARSGRAD